MTNTTNDFWKHIANVVAQGAVWLLPLTLLAFPHVGDLTISAVLSLIVSYLKSKYLPT